MSATNTTTNYNLPIFIGSDKPSWLADFNGAMNAIDAQMKTNADAIATKSPILTFNDTTEIELDKTGNVVTAMLASGVSDKVGRALVTPIAPPAEEQLVAVNTSGTQDAVTLGKGLELSSGVLNAIDLNLTDTGNDTTISLIGGAGSITGGFSYAFNQDHSIGKIYGNVNALSTAANIDYTISTSITVPAPAAAFDIFGCGQGYIGITPIQNLFSPSIHVDTDGKVSIKFSTRYTSGGNCYIRLYACIYFFKDFGDVPTP